MTKWINFGLAALIAALVSPPLVGATAGGATSDTAGDSLTSARALYAAAEYEDALLVLNRLQSGQGDRDGAAADPRAVAQVRAYCLLALGRTTDADQAIAVVIAADPTYRPSGAEASPRVRAAFSDVRRRLLPDIIQSQYAAAKAMFEAKDFAGARDLFSAVLQALADADVAAAAARPPLSDIRMLAGAFRDLAASAAQPVPIESRRQPVSMTAATLPPRIYSAADQQVTPPSALRQVLPVFRLQGTPPKPGQLELMIDEHGSVENAVMRSPMTPKYDEQVVAATRDWKYSPALLDGRPVKYRKLMQIAIQQ